MSLPTLSAAQLKTALVEVGVETGDGLLVHSALQFLGQPEGGEGMYLAVLEEVLGSEGTLAVPAFTFAFARGEDYDPAASPSEGMGVFSELVRQHPRAKRTSHPMQSLALIGAQANALAALDTPSAFDAGSAFERILKDGWKLLLLGAEVQAASIVHYSEQRAAVPYRYWKDFEGRVRGADGWARRRYRMFVRDLEIDAQLKLAPIQALLEERGQWARTEVNYGQIALCSLQDFVAAADDLLSADPWTLVGNRESLKL